MKLRVVGLMSGQEDWMIPIAATELKGTPSKLALKVGVVIMEMLGNPDVDKVIIVGDGNEDTHKE